MNIESAIYLKNEQTDEITSVKIVSGGVEYFVPISDDNYYYKEIMRQVEAGTLTIQPADEPPQEEPPAT